MGHGNGIQTLSKVDLDNPQKHWEKFHNTLKDYQVCCSWLIFFVEALENVPLSEPGPIHGR